jgi:hypothetical protein
LLAQGQVDQLPQHARWLMLALGSDTCALAEGLRELKQNRQIRPKDISNII